MPYIRECNRKQFDQTTLQNIQCATKGELEYCIYKLMKQYMLNKNWSYSELHNTVYAAVHCGDEFRRRYLDKRECEARRENGVIEPYIMGDN